MSQNSFLYEATDDTSPDIALDSLQAALGHDLSFQSVYFSRCLFTVRVHETEANLC